MNAEISGRRLRLTWSIMLTGGCLLFLIAASVVGISALGDEPKKSAKVQFNQLKKLAGEWSGKASHDGHDMDATVTYQVTSGGSAVMETLFCGTDHEMITMYHLHGDSLVLTHYCTLGNQPRLKSQPPDGSKKLVFKFLDGTNLDPKKDHHMHEATFEFVAENHLRAEWLSYNEGKPMMTAKFDLKRKVASGGK